MMGDAFPVVETPPWEERFVYTGGVKVSCVVCGQTGYKPESEAAEAGYPKWWTIIHREHVLCHCGKAVSKKGIGQHLSSMRRHGKPCQLRS